MNQGYNKGNIQLEEVFSLLDLGMFGFRALWSPYFFIVLSLISIGYYLLTVKYRSRYSDSEPLRNKEGILFIVSMVLIYVVKGSPIDLMGHLMFYAHMIQMAVLYLVIPPILIAAIPHWVWRKFLNKSINDKMFRFFTKPLVALILFNGIFSFYHIPLVFDFVKQNMWLHGLYTAALFLLAIFMWWPLMNGLKEYQSLNGLKKVGYVFASGVLLTPACGLIIFADNPMYQTYSDPQAWAEALKLCVPPSMLAGLELSGPEMFNSMSLLEDQRLGGVVMKIIQEIVYGVILAHIFFNWYRQEQEETELELAKSRIQPTVIE